MNRAFVVVSLAGLLVGTAGSAIVAQSTAPVAVPASALPAASKDTQDVQRHFESRADLERLALAAEKGGRTSEAWLLRYRLKNGDFQEGDRILLRVDGVTGLSDTLVVRKGKHVEFQRMADLSLDGVLRSELSDTLKYHLSKYLRSPEFRATALLPLAILGKVGAPGYYYMAADVVFRDVLTRARMSPQADLNKITIRREGKVIWKASDVRTALNDGLSVDRLHLRAGDEITVGGGRGFGIGSVLPFVMTGMSLYLAYTQTKGRRR